MEAPAANFRGLPARLFCPLLLSLSLFLFFWKRSNKGEKVGRRKLTLRTKSDYENRGAKIPRAHTNARDHRERLKDQWYRTRGEPQTNLFRERDTLVPVAFEADTGCYTLVIVPRSSSKPGQTTVYELPGNTRGRPREPPPARKRCPPR